MEYIYASLLLHKAGKEITEANVKKVVEAAGLKADDARLKALVAALKGVNIEEAVKSSAVPVAVPAASAPESEKKAAPKEEKKEEKKDESAAAAGLGALFG